MTVFTEQLANRNYLPTRKEQNKVADIVRNSNRQDVFIILFRKKDGELTQRVATRLGYSYGKNGENITFWSAMDEANGGYRCACLERVFSLTKVSRSQVEKLKFAGKI